MNVAYVGVAVLGMVLGYLTHYLVRRDENPGLGDLAGIGAVLLGGVVIKTVTPENSPADQVYWYLIGLGIGFFLYWLALMFGREKGEATVGKVDTKEIRSIQTGGEEFDSSDSVGGKRRLTLFPFLK